MSMQRSMHQFHPASKEVYRLNNQDLQDLADDAQIIQEYFRALLVMIIFK